MSGELEAHPLAETFPPLPPTELRELARDMKEHGQHYPIVLFEGKILEGRSRYEGCLMEDLEPKFENFDPEIHGDPLAFVISANVLRRHLAPIQKRDIIKKLLALAPERSSNSIAVDVGVSHHTVESVRREVEEETISPATDPPDIVGAQGGSLDSVGAPTPGEDPPATKPRVERSGKKARGRPPGTTGIKAPREAPQKARNAFVETIGIEMNRDLDATLEILTMMMRDWAPMIGKLPETRRQSLMNNCVKAFGLSAAIAADF